MDDASVDPDGEAESVASSKHESGNGSSTEEEIQIRCTRPNCGEYISPEGVDEHYEMHEAIDAVEVEEQSEQPK